MSGSGTIDNSTSHGLTRKAKAGTGLKLFFQVIERLSIIKLAGYEVGLNGFGKLSLGQYMLWLGSLTFP
ncbi:hypothetical protein GCM10027180_14500 [Microbulbifer echini]